MALSCRLPILALALAALLGNAQAGAQPAPEEITFGSASPTSTEWIVYIAREAGFFRGEGLHLSMVVTNSTVNSVQQVAAGDLDFADAGTDTVVNAVARKIPIKVIAPSMVTPPFSLMTLPAIRSWSDLKGKTISVAAKDNVTAIAFRRMASSNHLDWNNDFQIVTAGSTALRYAALRSGNVQGALLGQPYDFTAAAQGMRKLADSYRYLGPWSYDSIIANPVWAAAHRSTVVKFIRALRSAAAYGYTHRDEAIRVLAAETKSDPQIVAKTYDLDFLQWKAYDRNMQIDPKKVEGVIEGLVTQGALPAPIPVGDVIDDSYGRDAR